MDETTMSEAFGAAAEGFRNGATDMAGEAGRQIRENGERLARSARAGYDDANDYLGEVMRDRHLPAMLAVGAIGILIGLTLGRR